MDTALLREGENYSHWCSTNSPADIKNAAESLLGRFFFRNDLCTTVITNGGYDGNRSSGERDEGMEPS